MAELTSKDVSELVNILWDQPSTFQSTNSSEAFEAYYQRQWTSISRHDNGLHVALKTPAELHSLFQHLSTPSTMTRHQMLAALRNRSVEGTSNDALQNTLNLALSLLTMLKFGPLMGEVQPCRFLRWEEDCFGIYLQKHFAEKPVLDTNGTRLPRSFNAWSIQVIGGINIHFTDNLSDHLLLIEDREGMRVLIFHHVCYLRHHRRRTLFADDFVQETLDTLALIFPESEFGCVDGYKTSLSSWLKGICAKTWGRDIDSQLGLCKTLSVEDRRIEKFKYWRDRLIVLKQAYDDATPGTISQWWYDRRNRVVWCTFWIAVAVLVLGAITAIVQSVLAGLQTAKD